MRNFLYSGLWSVLTGAVASFMTALPGYAAEHITFSLGLLERSISIESLEAFAADDTVGPDLRLVLSFLDDTAEEDFRRALTQRNTLDVVAVAGSLYDPMIELSLRYIGNSIQTEKGLNGQYALRAAFILSAAQPDGFTFLDIIRNYPTGALRIDLDQVLANTRRVDRAFRETDHVIAGVEALASETADDESPPNLDGLPDVTQPGPYSYAQETITLDDASRDRTYPVDLYIPDAEATSPGSIPVVIISHGFGSQRSNFAFAAEYLASHGFFVAVPEHIGSNKALQEAVLAGQASEFFYPEEFLDRPLDVTYLLDDLEQRNSTTWDDRLNLQQVAALGHSFGGYTVLALGGAVVDLEYLRSSCTWENFEDFLNPALILQCRALALEESDPDILQQLVAGVKDERIQAVIALNPVNRSIFGPQGLNDIELPVVMVAGGYDIAAPVVPEQAFSFTQIDSIDKYMILIQGFSHTSTISEELDRILTPSLAPQELETLLQSLRSNGLGLVLAFLQVYIEGNEEYREMLQSSYALSLESPPFQFNLIREMTEEQLTEMLLVD